MNDLRIDPDQYRSASHRLMARHLTGPLQAGAADTELPVTLQGRVEVDFSTREPLVAAGPRASLGNVRLELRAVLEPDGAATALPALVYEPYTEAGAFLPLYLPPAGSGSAAPFSLGLSAYLGASAEPVAPERVGEYIEVRLIEGVLGRVIYTLGAEKCRIRRQAREIAACRSLDASRDDALDRIGADLATPRFADQIRYEKNQGEVYTETRQANGKPVAEPDEEFRRRLKLYRPLRVSNRSGLLEMLNGPGGAAEKNAGLLGEMGFADRFSLIEQDNEFAFAIRLVASGEAAAAHRERFLGFIRATHLVIPHTSGNKVHSQRFLSKGAGKTVAELRTRLRAQYGFEKDMAVAPRLAAAMDLAGRCRAALGFPDRVAVLRAQDEAAGSRYELGLGVDIKAIPAKEFDRMAETLHKMEKPAKDPEVAAALRSMRAAAPKRAGADDPDGKWFFSACGIRTVHRVEEGRVYLSHLPAFGLTITSASAPDAGGKLPLQAQYNAPGDPGGHALLVSALASASARWTAEGGKPFSVLPDAQARNGWDKAQPLTPQGVSAFQKAGLPAIADPRPLVPRLKNLPAEHVATVQLHQTLAQAVLTAPDEAAAPLTKLAGILESEGVASALPLITSAGQVLLVLGVIALPEAGANLAERRTAGFRWYVVPITGKGGDIQPLGSRTVFAPKGAGLCAVVVVGYQRRQFTDPYECRIELPDGARLNLLQYEFLMNLLEHACPMGVEINTFSIRKRHVDLNDDGAAEPLPPRVSKTYRQFRRRRNRGEVGVDVLERPTE